MNDNSSRVIEVEINDVLPNRFQPRIKFDEEEILELSDSIKEHGVIQPIVVRPIGDKYEIIAGERRYKASVLAGKETVPVIIKNLNDKDSAEIALIENIQRKNLTPIEEALSYKKILDMGYITQENLAVKLGKSQPAVANKIRLLNLSDEVQEALLENKISERHARSLLKLSTFSQQNQMLERIITERLTVRKADEEIEKMKNSTSDEEASEPQKIIEKGEFSMNNDNNIFGMPSVPQQPVNTQSEMSQQPVFDIFGMGVPQSQTNPQVTMPESLMQTQVSESPVVPTPNFDIFASQSEPSNNVFTDVNQAPSVPQISNVSAPSIVEQSVDPQPKESQTFIMPEIPSFQAEPSIPVMNSIGEPQSMNLNLDVPKQSSVEQSPGVPSFIEPTIPSMQPIVETPEVPLSMPEPQVITQQPENTFEFGFNPQSSNNVEPMIEEIPQPVQSTVPEFKIPEPIIVTDYSKQYDPIMPPTIENIRPTVDFKEVINAIRDCSNKIEQYGFKIDVEEYDLTNLYQVIFKIEKN